MSDIIIEQQKPQKEKARQSTVYDIDKFLSEIEYPNKTDKLKNYFRTLVKLEKATKRDDYLKLWNRKIKGEN